MGESLGEDGAETLQTLLLLQPPPPTLALVRLAFVPGVIAPRLFSVARLPSFLSPYNSLPRKSCLSPTYFLSCSISYLHQQELGFLLDSVYQKFDTPIIYSVALVSHLWPLGFLGSDSCVLLTNSHLFRVLPYFLAPQDVPGSSSIFPAPAPGPAPSPHSFYRRMMVRDQDTGTRRAQCYWGCYCFQLSQLRIIRIDSK